MNVSFLIFGTLFDISFNCSNFFIRSDVLTLAVSRNLGVTLQFVVVLLTLNSFVLGAEFGKHELNLFSLIEPQATPASILFASVSTQDLEKPPSLPEFLHETALSFVESPFRAIFEAPELSGWLDWQFFNFNSQSSPIFETTFESNSDVAHGDLVLIFTFSTPLQELFSSKPELIEFDATGDRRSATELASSKVRPSEASASTASRNATDLRVVLGEILRFSTFGSGTQRPDRRRSNALSPSAKGGVASAESELSSPRLDIRDE